MCYFCLGRKSIFGALVPQRVTFTVQFDLLLSCKLYSTASVCFDAPAASGSVRFFLLLRNDPKDFPQVACTRRSYRFFLNPVLSSFSSSLSSLSFSFLSCFFFQRAIGIDTVQRVEKFPFDRSDINVFYFELFKDRRRNVQELERYTSFATFFDHITSCNCMKCSMTKRIFQRRILRLCSALLQRCTNRFNLFKPVNQATLVGQ